MVEAILQRVSEEGADALLVTQPANVRYLSGFSSPQDARVLVSDASSVLITDGRYIAQAQSESRLSVEIVKEQRAALELVKSRLSGRRLAVESEHLTLAGYADLRDALGQEPIQSKGIVKKLRLRKTPFEADKLRQAATLADQAFSYILGIIGPGLKEIEVALELEAFMLRAGAEAKSFGIIVASGTRSAMPHGVASQKAVAAGELVTLDFGAVIDGYHSDMTRTIAVGDVAEDLRAMYHAVLEAQEAALAALGPGKDGKELDALARDTLARHELQDYFAHGLGHGVGLEVHEEPRLTFQTSYMLEPGMTATVEPGVYIPGKAGVRIEDLTLITDRGFELLSHSDKHLITV